jgi:hypothetical protein
MVEHDPPPSADDPRRPLVIPLPIALYVSGELIFELYDGGQPCRRFFDSLGKAHAKDRRRAGDKEIPSGFADTPRLVPAFHDPPDTDFHLIAKC